MEESEERCADDVEINIVSIKRERANTPPKCKKSKRKKKQPKIKYQNKR